MAVSLPALTSLQDGAIDLSLKDWLVKDCPKAVHIVGIGLKDPQCSLKANLDMASIVPASAL